MTSVGFVFRYYNIVAKARELLKGRTIHIVRMRYYAPMMLQYEKFPPFYFQNEVSGGMIVDQALHMIDLARYVVGDEVSEVHGVGSNLFQPKTKQITTDENVTLNLRFERGTVGSHVHSWGYANWTQEAEFVSPQARLILDLGGQKLTGVVDGVTVEYKPEENGYNAELEAMLAAVRSGDRALIRSTYEDAVKTLGICLAANRSLETRNVEKVEQA
jgi:predicted dehydrogenase